MKYSTELFFFIVSFVFCIPVFAQDTLVVSKENQSIRLMPYLNVWEDLRKTTTVDSLSSRQEGFVPLLGFERESPTSAFWLKANLFNPYDREMSQVLSFGTLSYVDVWLTDSGGRRLGPIRSGSFRAESQLDPDASRRHVLLDLAPGMAYQLVVRVEHTKKYDPQLVFSLTDAGTFFRSDFTKRLLDIFLMGGMAVGFLSTLFSFLTRFYKPYLWLMLYIIGLSGYSLGASGYLVDWFIPEHPVFGAKVTVLFVYILLGGFYLLTIDFCNIRALNYSVYLLFRRTILGMIAISPLVLALNFMGNFYLMSMCMATIAIVLSALVLYGLYRCHRLLNSAQRIHAAGILVFVVTALLIDFSILIFGEKALRQYGLLSMSAGIVTYVLFDIALKKQLFLYELEKRTALVELNALQQNQNRFLEESVEARTHELNIQKELLEDSYRQIKLLNLEMQHRIKNNLQFLYGLFKLREMSNTNEEVREILKFGLCKIGIMAVMQDHLHKEKPHHVPLDDYIRKIIQHTAELYQGMNRVSIQDNISPEIVLSNSRSLSLGLIIAELLTNSMKHAFADSPDPLIRIDINKIGQNVVLTYIDNGAGPIRKDTEGVVKGTGLSLIADLARQLNGIYAIRFEKGMSVNLNFPLS